MSSSLFALTKPSVLNMLLPPLPLKTPRRPIPTPTLAVIGPPAIAKVVPIPPNVRFLKNAALPSESLTAPLAVVLSITALALMSPLSEFIIILFQDLSVILPRYSNFSLG